MKGKTNKSQIPKILTISLLILNSTSLKMKLWKGIDLEAGLEQIEDLDEKVLLKKATDQRVKELVTPVINLQDKVKDFVKKVKLDNKEIIERIKEGKKPIKAEKLKKVDKKMKLKSLKNEVNKNKKVVEKIIIPRVVINEKKKLPGKPLRKILINKLIVLNSDNDDPDKNTVFIEKAVIDPSVYRDKTIENFLKKREKGFNDQINAITEQLNKIKLSNGKSSEEERKKEHKNVKHQISRIKTALKNIQFPVIPKKYRLKAEEDEVKKFEKNLENEIEIINSINKDEEVQGKLSDFQEILKKVKKTEENKGDLEKISEGITKLLLKEEEFKERILKHKKRMEEMLKKHRLFVVKGDEEHSKALKMLESEVKGG